MPWEWGSVIGCSLQRVESTCHTENSATQLSVFPWCYKSATIILVSPFCWMLHIGNVQVEMKVERKLSDFSTEKQKQNENMKTKTEICGTEIEREFFWRKWKQKRNIVFWRNSCRNGSFCFRLIRNFCFMVVLYGKSSRSNMWLCHIELSKQPTPTLQLHWVILTDLGNKFFVLLNLLEFCCMIQVVF
jgi:hypothetical protein